MEVIIAVVLVSLFSLAALWSEFISPGTKAKLKENFNLSPETKTACKEYFKGKLPMMITLMVIATAVGFCIGIISGQVN